MGFFTRGIAKESRKPAKVSLSGAPNYIQFESFNDPSENKYFSGTIQVLKSRVANDKAKFTIRYEKNGSFELNGTDKSEEVNDITFHMHENDKSITAENIRACLLTDDYLRSNFYITIPTTKYRNLLSNGDTIKIEAIDPSSTVSIRIVFTDEEFIKTEGITRVTLKKNETKDEYDEIVEGVAQPPIINNDTIVGESGDSEIELELYRDTNIFLGVDDTPEAGKPFGIYLGTLSKAYFNTPIWFNLNSLLSSAKSFSNRILNSEGWTDTGSMTNFRFVARKFDGIDRVPFYISDALYVVNGYDRALEKNDLSAYVYDTRVKNIVKPLSRQPQLFHVEGQVQYFNFILSDPDRNIDLRANEYNLGIVYKLYSQSRRLIETVVAHEQNRKLFSMINTIRLDIDGAVRSRKAIDDTVGYVEVCLCRSGKETSEPLKFSILPSSLYDVNDFVFFNALGGWSSFSFSGKDSGEFKSKANTIYKTQTPDHTISSEIESVYRKEITEQFVVQTMPVDRTICEWLKELSSSEAVYELSTKRYVIVDELTIKPNSKEDLFRIDMKYHYSDTYNGLIK